MEIDNHASDRLKRLLGYLQEDPSNSRLLFDVVDQCIREGQIDTATRLIEQARAVGMPLADIQYREATIAMSKGAYPDAVRMLEALLAHDHGNATLRYDLAYANYQAGDYPRARDLLEGIAEHAAANPGIATLYALSLHQLGEVDAAIAFAESSLTTQPNHLELPGILALLYFDANRMAQCRHYVDIALRLMPDHPMALVAASNLAVLDAQLDRAEQLARQVLAHNDREGRAWSALGSALLGKQDISGAGRALQQAVKYLPNHIGTWHLLAWTQVFQYNSLAAEVSFKRALELDRTFGESHGGLAVVAQMRGDDERAQKLMEKARRLSPNGLAIQYMKLLQIEQREGKAAAQAFLQKVLEHSPGADGVPLLGSVQRLLLEHPASRK